MKKLTNKKTLITALCAILVVVAMVFTLTACDGNKDKEPTSTTAPSTIEEVVTTEKEVVEPITDDETTIETETTTKEVVETEAPTQKPTEAPKPTPEPTEAPTKSPATTKAPEKPKETEKANTGTPLDELPMENGWFDASAFDDKEIEEENGGVAYF